MEAINDYIKEVERKGYTKEFSQHLVQDFIEQVHTEMFCIWGDEGWAKYMDAVLFAVQAHAGDVRKGTDIPYVIHPVEASVIATDMTKDADVVIGAVLHDIVEDTEYGIEDIRQRFGMKIAALVGNETENKRPEMDKKASWRVRKEEFLAHLRNASKESMIITLSDKLSNMRALCYDYRNIGDELWQRFNQKDIKQQEWYYRSIAEITKERLSHTESWQEYMRLCDEVF